LGTTCRHQPRPLWRDQRKRAEARDLLAPVHGGFTEGFDTPVEARSPPPLCNHPPTLALPTAGSVCSRPGWRPRGLHCLERPLWVRNGTTRTSRPRSRRSAGGWTRQWREADIASRSIRISFGSKIGYLSWLSGRRGQVEAIFGAAIVLSAASAQQGITHSFSWTFFDWERRHGSCQSSRLHGCICGERRCTKFRSRSSPKYEQHGLGNDVTGRARCRVR
jgi:hypothetical protein